MPASKLSAALHRLSGGRLGDGQAELLHGDGLVDAGIVVVAAAGNNGKNSAGQKLYGLIHSPGNEPSAITVGASNFDFRINGDIEVHGGGNADRLILNDSLNYGGDDYTLTSTRFTRSAHQA